MRRKLFNCASVVSLVLCLGTTALWVRSRQTTVVLVHYQRKQAQWQVVLSHGRVGVNNQPQLDWEKSQRFLLNQQLRDAEIRRIIALKTLENRRIQFLLEYKNNLRQVEEAEQGDVETIRRSNALAGAIRDSARIMSAIKALATPLVPCEMSFALPTALFAVLPVVWLWRCYARRKTIARGMCVECGYDLTGNVSGTCPECGRPVPEDVGNSTAAASGSQTT